MKSSTYRDDVLARADIHAIINPRVPLIKQGNEFAALCPFHDERSPSFTVTPGKNLFYCFGCGATGNAVDFVMKYDGLTFPEALDRVASECGVQKPEPAKPKPRTKIVKTYDYIDENGELIYQVCRMEPKDFRQRRPDGDGWNWSIKDCRQIPYNLPAMLAKPTHTVIIVEGEKDADNLTAAGLLSTTNSGGSKKFPDDLCQHFTGRNVVILPDNDEPGRAHASLVAAKLSRIAASVRVVELPGLPAKGDVSDWLAAGGTADQLRALCKAAPVWIQPTDDDHLIPDRAEREPMPEHDGAPAHILDAETDERQTTAPFRALGFDDGHYYFLPHKTQQVTSISSGSMTSTSQLLTLAGLEWWNHSFPSKSSVDWTAAANAAIRWCEQSGTFDPGAIRGRGAWFDNGRSVLHLGNRLLVDRQPTSLHALDSRFIYQRAPGLESGDVVEPMTHNDAETLSKIVDGMNWSRATDRMMFAGWLVLAPICGALAWRPHIWITGQRGSGKSWMVDNVVSPVIGSTALVVQGNSTEAGIRQQLKQDARPILFDEAEGESVTGRLRMQNVLELARQASSDGLAQIAKGTAGGKALTYRVRSMFMLGSINVGLSQAADKSRFSVLTLGKSKPGPTGRQQFDALQTLVNNTLTSDWCARLRSRTYGLIPTIRQNAATFSKAAAETIGNQRAGDQVGALLAGSYALHSDDRISLDDARVYVQAFDWAEQEDEKTESDESALLAEILHAQLRVDTGHGVRSRSVAELIQYYAGGAEPDKELAGIDANQVLVRHGIKVKNESLIVSDSHPELRTILEKTAWAGGWGRILARIDGAETVKKIRFAGVFHRAVSIPISAVMG